MGETTMDPLLIRPFLDDLWRWSADYRESSSYPKNVQPLTVLKKKQWSEEFERLMRNRLILGRFRYGEVSASRYPSAKMAIRRLHLYLQTGNKEFLVDAANLALVEYVSPGCRKHTKFKGGSKEERKCISFSKKLEPKSSG
jgi:hypothetical protein